VDLGQFWEKTMRSVISLLVVATISLGAYFYFLKQAAPPGRVVTQAISTTGVEMDLTAIAQAERSYFAQNGAYASLEQLTAGGGLARSERDGYTYAVETSPAGFTATARHTDAAPSVNNAVPPHYPVISVNQSMQIHQSD
jgi:hypothetical protein